MHYYILVNEWNYPTESGREIIGDFDDLQDAEYHAKDECEREFDNFQEVCKDYYRDGSGYFNDGNSTGYIMHSSQDESMDFFFRSVVIRREVL